VKLLSLLTKALQNLGTEAAAASILNVSTAQKACSIPTNQGHLTQFRCWVPFRGI